MILPNPKGWLAVFFIIFTLAIPFAITYYVSTDTFKTRYQDWRAQNMSAGIPSRSKIVKGSAVLVRDQELEIDKTRLVYKGLENGQILIDLYLLELDPEQPYPRAIPKKQTRESIRLGPNVYKIDSANAKILKLKIQHRFQTQ